MGARQSKRSVDITTTPKKGDNELLAEGEGKLEKIGDADVKVATNGTVPHNDLEVGEKEENATAEKDQPAEEVKENGLPEEEPVKTPNTPDTDTSSADQLNESVATDKTADSANESKIEETPEAKKTKEKKKKKWSFRSISFSKKDKSKPSKEDKNDEVKEVAEENADETATSPTTEPPKEEEKPAAETEASSAPAAGEENAEPIVESGEGENAKKTEQPTPAPIIEAPKVLEPVCEKPVESAPSPVKEDVPPIETPKVVEDSKSVESKEVRSDDVPPPLPSSNPPSPVTVFAESTKADVLTVQEIPILQSSPASVELVLEPTFIPSASSGSAVNDTASETKQELTLVKPEAGDGKSESIVSEIEKTENELKTVEKTIDITSESSDAIISENSDAKNLSETLNNISSIETSETVVASSEPLPQSDDTSSEAPVVSETFPESVQPPPIEEIPVDVVKSSDAQLECVVESTHSQVAQEQPTNTDIKSETSKKAEILPEFLKESPISPEALPELIRDTHENVNTLPEPPKDTSKFADQLTQSPKETSESLEALPEPPKETSKLHELLQDASKEVASAEILQESSEVIESCPLKEMNKTSESVETVPLKMESPIVETPAEAKNVIETESQHISKDSEIFLPEPIETPEIPVVPEIKEVAQSIIPAISPVPTQSSEKLPASPQSPAIISDGIKPSLEEFLSEPVVPSPELESHVINTADSLPDISTESLPSLPEPFSENLAEPMSLPPVDSVPEPIAVDSPTSDPPLVTECPAPVLSNNSEVLTNGNTNGLPSPVTEEVSPAQPKMMEGPLKQVISSDACEVRQEVGDAATESSVTPAASATVEE